MRRGVPALALAGAVFVGTAWAGGTAPAPAGASKPSSVSKTASPSKPAPGSKAAHASTTPAGSFDFSRGIGMVEGTKDTIWLMIADSTLATGDSLTLISDEPSPDSSTLVTLISATVAGRVLDPQRDARAPRWFAMGSEAGDALYRLAVAPGALDCCIFGYAVRAPRSVFRVVSGRAEADLDGDGVPERFQSCASLEGLHPTVWSGEPLRGVERWSRYYYMGYDLEPNCPGTDRPIAK